MKKSIIVLFLIILLTGCSLKPKQDENENNIPINIPDVSNMTIEDAKTKLQEVGFNVSLNVEYISSEKIESGLVAKTSPSIGRAVKKGQTIILYVSTGSRDYIIENYVGKNYIEVKTLLENNYGLNVIIKKMVSEDNKIYSEDVIIKQDLEVGTKVVKGSNITLYIPDKVLEYPDFTDGTWTVDDITRFGEEYELVINFKYEAKSGYNEGEIISQSRAAKSPIIKGISVTIVVAK